jgi:hypothetical protein
MFVIAVRDLGRSVAIYRDVLGLDVRAMGDPGWRMFVRDGCRRQKPLPAESAAHRL